VVGETPDPTAGDDAGATVEEPFVKPTFV